MPAPTLLPPVDAGSDHLVPALRSKSAFFGPDGARPGAATVKGRAGAAAVTPHPAHRIPDFTPARGGGGGSDDGGVNNAAAAAAAAAAATAVPYSPSTPFTQRTELYRGAVSTIFSARCPVTGRSVILKEYDRGRMKPKHAARVERECAAMAALADLPSVVRLHGRFDDAPSNRTTLVVEHCTGGDLFRALVLAHGRGLGCEYTARAVIAPLLATLAAAHARGIIHRDIKPENLFVTAEEEGVWGGGGAGGGTDARPPGLRPPPPSSPPGTVKLGDFGLAIDTRRELPFSRSGTLDYMAPEVLANPALPDLDEAPPITRSQLAARGARPYGPAVDVWAVGVLAYECVVGRPPFDAGGDDAATAARVLYSDAVALPPTHGPEWAAFVAAALAKRPTERPSAAALLAHPWLAMHGVGTAAPPSVAVAAGRAATGARAAAAARATPSSSDGASTASTCSTGSSSPCSSVDGDVVGWPARGGVRGAAGAPPPQPPPKRHPLAGLRALATSARVPAASPAALVPRSGASFVDLLRRAPPGGAAPLDGGSGDGAAAAEGRGGLRVRVAHYFHRQRHAGAA